MCAGKAQLCCQCVISKTDRLTDEPVWIIFLPINALEKYEGKITHRFRWLNQLAINNTHLDCEVNVLEYQEEC